MPLLSLLRTREVRNLYASCTPVLSRLYRHFGFKVIVKDASEQPDGTYSLIHGEIPEVLMALAGNDAERELAASELVAWEARQRKVA